MHGTTIEDATELRRGPSTPLIVAEKPTNCSVTEGSEQAGSNFDAVLLAIAAHDLRQPLQVLKSAYERLGVGLQTSAELRLIRLGEKAIGRLTQQLG